ncbi:MAG: hypothetical protein EB090_05800 [Verrucomicrobia bacterium]|nr:hypothetical protein [Verrucomicrobiota bacterium]
METTPLPKPGPSRDRAIAVGMIALSALLACGWMMRERQWAADLAESREDLRQVLHRLQTLSASTDQIRSAYLQRKAELENARKKLESAAARSQEDKPRTTPAAGTNEKPRDNAALTALLEKISQAKLPSWAAVEKTAGAVRVLPGAGVPAGNEGFAAFGSLAPSLVAADTGATLELVARAEPGSDGWETAQERGHRLLASAEKSLKGQTSRIRLRIETVKGPRMEWRIVPAETAAAPASDSKPAHR